MNWTAILWTAVFSVGTVVAIRALQDVAEDIRFHGLTDSLAARRRRLVIALVAILMHLAIGVETFLPFDFEAEGLLLLFGLFGGGIGFIVFVFLERSDRAHIRKTMK